MKTTVKYVSVNYLHEEGSNKITCKLTCELLYEKIKWLNYFINYYDVQTYLRKLKHNAEYKDGKIYIYISADAKCCDEDVFDYELGRKIALTRAQKYAFIRAGEIYWDIQNRIIRDLYNTSMNCFYSSLDCARHEAILAGFDNFDNSLAFDDEIYINGDDDIIQYFMKDN